MFSVDLGTPMANVVSWLTTNLSGFFGTVAVIVTELVNVVLMALTAPHPFLVTALFALLAYAVRSWGFAAFTLFAFLLIQAMGLWVESMQSLALVIVASAIAVAVGVPLGVWAARSRRASVIVRPVLDVMQTLPVFVYLIPAVFFFGIGLVPGVVATTIFAIPPAVRLTELGIRQVDREVVEAARAFGAKPSQVLREVQLPLALPTITAGVNQVIMLALSMVVIAGMVGSAGLGTVVVRGISQLDVGAGFEGGLAVVFLAIFLDRVTSSLSKPGRGRLSEFLQRLRRPTPVPEQRTDRQADDKAVMVSSPSQGVSS